MEHGHTCRYDGRVTCTHQRIEPTNFRCSVRCRKCILVEGLARFEPDQKKRTRRTQRNIFIDRTIRPEEVAPAARSGAKNRLYKISGSPRLASRTFTAM